MIALYPLLLVALALIVHRRRRAGGGKGWRFFLLWAAGGVVFLLALVTGFALGLYSFAVAAAVGCAVAFASPSWPEAAGFAAGALAVVALLFWANGDAIALLPAMLAAGCAAGYGAVAARRRALGVVR